MINPQWLEVNLHGSKDVPVIEVRAIEILLTSYTYAYFYIYPKCFRGEIKYKISILVKRSCLDLWDKMND